MFNSGGTLWCKPPDAPSVDREGRAALRADGKRVYDECVGFTDDQTSTEAEIAAIAEVVGLLAATAVLAEGLVGLRVARRGST